METSNKFKLIEINLLKLLEILLQNENIKKYIVYLIDDPLSQPNVTKNLIESNNIILAPFDESILTDQRITVLINPVEGNFNSQSALSDLTFLIDIIIPNSKWLMGKNGGQLRAFRLADEISQTIDQKRIMGMTQTEITRYRIFKAGSNHSGISLFVNVNSSTMKGL